MEISIAEEEQRKLWLEMLEPYDNSMTIIRKKGTNYTEQELKKYQEEANKF